MFKENTIGIVGHGFVGKALEEGMKHAFTARVFDLKYSGDTNETLAGSLRELCQESEVIFVCVPTPMQADGSCDTSIVERVVKEIDSFQFKNVVVIKSTVPPGTTRRLAEASLWLKGVVFNPEFLTEANYVEDFKNQTRIILGGEEPGKSAVKAVYAKAYPNVPTIKTSSTIAEMVKYMTNTFLATKVAFANEMFQVCSKLGIDYDKVVEYARYDERLGSTHWAVPGPDGHHGFGGSCFPKDINALISVAQDLEVDPTVLRGAWKKNIEVRPERDWEKLAGRAVTGGKTLYWSRIPGNFLNRYTGEEKGAMPFQGTVREWYETLIETIIDMSKTLGADYRKQPVLVRCSGVALSIIESSYAYRATGREINDASLLPAKNVVGGTFIGHIRQRVIVYDDVNVPEDEVWVSFDDDGRQVVGKIRIKDLNII